jgi:ABC-type sugar transport system permease subunit
MASEMRLHNLKWALLTVIFIIVSSVALGLLARLIARLRGLSETEQRKVFWGFTFAGPWIVGFFIFVLGPALASLYYSFTNYELGQKIEWIGLDNYRKMLLVYGRQGRQFNKAMLNSFYYALIGVPLQILAALIMALLLNNEVRGIRFFRMVFYMPVILAGGPAILLAWRYMLTTNGGFVNEAMRKIASTFFVFDYLYRGFIYGMEAFNGFYAGIAQGDPIGPLKYTAPTLLGAVILWLLARGEWSEGKRLLAWRAAQIVGLAVFFRLASKGLMAQPVDPAWLYAAGIAALGGVAWLARLRHPRLRRTQGALLAVTIALGIVVLARGGFALDDAGTQRYLLPLALTALALLGTWIGPWTARTYRLLVLFGALLSLLLLVRLAPGQLDGGRLEVLTHYLTFGSTLDTTDDLDYLNKVYPAQTMSSLWFYGLAIGAWLGVAWLGEARPRTRRRLAWGGAIVFALLALGSFLDGRTYFQAFERIAQASGKPNYHFSLFRQAIAQFPSSDRVPLWMNSELWSKPALILITMWSSGTGMLIFLAALKNVPQSLYEAAEVDGANVWQRFFKITLPMISPAMFYNIVIGMIAALQTFETIYILQTPLTLDSLQSAAYLLYARTFSELHIGEGAAMSWILVVIILTLTVLQFRFSRSWVHYEA